MRPRIVGVSSTTFRVSTIKLASETGSPSMRSGCASSAAAFSWKSGSATTSRHSARRAMVNKDARLRSNVVSDACDLDNNGHPRNE
ncbi:hypothetical protein PybrP1_003250 [[Pythium] brassicae (nom. inval.)]|nr:hypothetical protein PybrP1_003250 [[Pythium] brassicae (nom. inval.)]